MSGQRVFARLRLLGMCDSWFHFNDVVVNVLLRSEQTLLNTLDNLFSFELISEVVQKHLLPVTLTI